jgi:sugar phosphate isomerase/epimerase
VASGASLRRSIFDVLPEIQAAGAAGFEVGTPPGHFAPGDRAEVHRLIEAVRAGGPRPISIHAPFGPSLDLASPDRHIREMAIAAHATAADALKQLGGKIVVVHPSDLERQGRDVEERLSDCARSLGIVADYCHDLGLILAVESPLPHLIGGHPEEFRWLLAQLDPTARVCLDTGHLALGHHWDRFLALAGGRLAHVHASDNHGTHDDHLPPGDGRIDWAHVRHTLAAAGFHGWIMLELSCNDGCLDLFRRGLDQARRVLGETRTLETPSP